MPSFDVVSELDKHEVTNAVENAVKELDRRYDLKGKGSFEFKEKELTVNLTAEADFQLEAMIEILKLALVKRKIDVQCLEVKDAYASGKLMKQEAVLKEGIDKEMAKKIVAHIKDADIQFFLPPTVPGFGNASGFELRLQDKTAGTFAELDEVAKNFVAKLNADPRLTGVTSGFNPNFPQYMIDIDAAACKKAGISPSDILSTMQGYFGGLPQSRRGWRRRKNGKC